MRTMFSSIIAASIAAMFRYRSRMIFALVLIVIGTGCAPYTVKQIGAKRKKSYHAKPPRITTPWR